MQTATQRVAEFVAGFDLAQAPAEVVEKAKVTVLHDLGVGLAGYQLAGPAIDLATTVGACPAGTGARLPVDGTTVNIEMATLATAAMVHARTQDDTQISVVTHLGCTTLPALIALGDLRDASGRELLTAMVAGYEAASAIADGSGVAATGRGFRATSVYGPFAAAAASSRMLGLSAEQTANALGLAAAFGGGTNQTWVAGTQEWQYQVGAASRSGMLAALLAERGVTGAPDALEGSAGHDRAFTGTIRDGDLGAGLGTDWLTRTVTYKPFPVCAINQVPVTTMAGLVERHGFTADDVDEVTLSLAPHEAAYPGTDTHGPFLDVGATLMSAPYCLAVAILERGVDLADLRRFDDPEVMKLVDRITVRPDDTLPGNSCRIAVRTRGGDVHRDEFISGPTTFNWGRDEAATRLHAIVHDMPLTTTQLDGFIAVVGDLDNRQVGDLITATLR